MGNKDLLLYGVAGLVSSATLAAFHWTPVGGGANVRDRRICYALGTAVVIGVPAAAMKIASAMGYERPQSYWAAFLLTNTFVSGLAVQVCYLIDDGQPVSLDDVRKHGDSL